MLRQESRPTMHYAHLVSASGSHSKAERGLAKLNVTRSLDYQTSMLSPELMNQTVWLATQVQLLCNWDDFSAIYRRWLEDSGWYWSNDSSLSMTSDANCLTVQGRIPISEIASISSVGICDKAAEKLFFRDVICPCIRHGKKTSIKNLPTICDGFRSISPSRLNAHTHFNFISILSCPLSFTIIHVVICKCSNGRNTSKAFGGFSCFIYSNFFLFQISNL